MSFQFLLNSQIYLFERISDVWNNQWDFRSNIFCQWCLIQVKFWTAHRDCQCLRRARQNFLCIGRMGFSMVHFHNFLTYLTLVPIDIVITSARPGKVSCADNGQLGIFVAHFRNFLPQCCAAKNVSWFENLWKEIRKELKQLFLLMLKFKVSQELDVHLSVLFYVAMSKRLEIQS